MLVKVFSHGHHLECTRVFFHSQNATDGQIIFATCWRFVAWKSTQKGMSPAPQEQLCLWVRMDVSWKHPSNQSPIPNWNKITVEPCASELAISNNPLFWAQSYGISLGFALQSFTISSCDLLLFQKYFFWEFEILGFNCTKMCIYLSVV